MWQVLENQVDRTVLLTGEVIAYAEQRRTLVRPRPDKPESTRNGSLPR
jgi:hypothetical protein